MEILICVFVLMVACAALIGLLNGWWPFQRVTKIVRPVLTNEERIARLQADLDDRLAKAHLTVPPEIRVVYDSLLNGDWKEGFGYSAFEYKKDDMRLSAYQNQDRHSVYLYVSGASIELSDLAKDVLGTATMILQIRREEARRKADIENYAMFKSKVL